MLEKPAEKVAWESAAFGKTIVFLREKAFAYNMARRNYALILI